MVVSRPAWKTACAASGSAQMLNSAAGVMFPSAIAPPIRTMRSMFAPPVRSSSRATFVSGPVGTSVTGVGARRDRPLHEVDGMLAERRPAGGRKRRAVEPALAVDVGGHGELARRAADRRRQRPGCRRRPTRSSTRSAFCGRLLERLVAVHRRHAEHLELRACEREQQRDRVVVPRIAVEDDRDAHRAEYGVDLGRGRQGRLRAEAATPRGRRPRTRA